MLTMEEIIRRGRGDILRRWVEVARSGAAARGLTGPELLNLMPAYLSALSGSDQARVLELVERHFSSRVRHGFNLGEIVGEFTLLMRLVVQAWSDTPEGERPPSADLERVLILVQEASTRMADMYARYVFDHAQTEKRYLRLLRQAFTSVPPTEPAPRKGLSDRLHAAMEVVMEAMDADTAAILLYDDATDDLVMTASAGVAAEGAARYARDRSSLASLIASREETTKIADARTTELAVSDALRNSGIHAVLGARLPLQRKLVGVMYIGTREQRSFGATERRMMEALAESLSLLIENVQLQDAVERQLEQVQVEQRLRDVIISVVAHDLRGPIAAAQLAAQVLTRTKYALPPSDQQRKMELILRNLGRIDHMVEDLLDAQRLHAGEKLATQPEPCDLAAVARDVRDELSAQHGARFEIDAPAEPVEGTWDPGQLRRSIWNLASNALKYGKAGAAVRIAARRRPGGAELSVHNEGRAIPPEEQAGLFEPFTRGRREEGGPRGWGLGLTLVRAVAEAHGGTIEVDSGPDRGTTFTLRLPSGAAPEGAGAPDEAPPSEARDDPAAGLRATRGG